jgi:type VI secretion system secreted protein Hcp
MRGKRSLSAVYAVAVLLTFLISSANAAEFRVKIKSTKSPIPEFAAQSVDSVTRSPRDRATGLPSGKRQQQAVTVVKEWGPASSQLQHAMQINQDLEEVLIEEVSGNTVLRSMKLSNAAISRIQMSGGGGGRKKKKSGGELEKVTFTYQKIEITTPKGKSTAVDDWEARQ